MYLPEKLQEQNYVTWNHTVKGLMRVWEIANKLGLERRLEERLRRDTSCALAEKVAAIGNDPRRLADLFRNCVRPVTAAELRVHREPIFGVVVIRDEAQIGEKVA